MQHATHTSLHKCVLGFHSNQEFCFLPVYRCNRPIDRFQREEDKHYVQKDASEGKKIRVGPLCQDTVDPLDLHFPF